MMKTMTTTKIESLMFFLSSWWFRARLMMMRGPGWAVITSAIWDLFWSTCVFFISKRLASVFFLSLLSDDDDGELSNALISSPFQTGTERLVSTTINRAQERRGILIFLRTITRFTWKRRSTFFALALVFFSIWHVLNTLTMIELRQPKNEQILSKNHSRRCQRDWMDRPVRADSGTRSRGPPKSLRSRHPARRIRLPKTLRRLPHPLLTRNFRTSHRHRIRRPVLDPRSV